MLQLCLLALAALRLAMADRNDTIEAVQLTLTPQGAWNIATDVRKTPEGRDARLAFTSVDGASASFRFVGELSSLSLPYFYFIHAHRNGSLRARTASDESCVYS